MHFDYKIWRPMVCASLVVLSANLAHADSYSLENAVTTCLLYTSDAADE